MTNQELPADPFPELVAANAELSRACEAHAAKAERWHRRAIEQEHELAAARELLEAQARMIEQRTEERDNLAAYRLDDAQTVAAAQRARDADSDRLTRCARRVGELLMERDALTGQNAALLRELHALQDVYIATLAEMDGLRRERDKPNETSSR